MAARTAARPTRAPRKPPLGPPPRKTFKLASSRRRAAVVIIAFAFVLSLFASRLVELQVVRGDELAQSALNQRLVKEQIPATRGTIADVNGRPLAVSVEIRDITVDQTLVNDATETATVLGPMLGMPAEDLEPLLTGERRFTYLKKSTEPQVWRDIQAWRAEPDNNSEILQGIFSERRTVREYPNGNLAANVIGFTNAAGVGAVGLEHGLNQELAGTSGSVSYEEAANGAVIPTSEVNLDSPEPGSDVRLTLDADIQATAQNAITRKVNESGSDFGMVVALEVGTGRILAMATGPSFDPSRPDKVEPDDWTNRPATWAMEPGSTAKLMTMAAVLNENAMKPRSRIVVPVSLPRGGKAFKDSSPHGVLQLTLAGVLAKSSNMGTILASEEIGGRKLYKYLKKFGVGEPSGLQFPGEANGYVPKPKDWSPTTFPTLAFGQGLSLTAIQIANMFATIGNDGVYVPPRVIDSFKNSDGTISTPDKGDERRVISTETARTMQKMLQTVTQEGGTGANVKVPGYLLGGKTGTADRYDEDRGNYSGFTASFVGMAPADKPEIVVGAWLDNPRGMHYGGVLGGPIVAEVMTASLAKLGIPPTGGKASNYPINWEKKVVVDDKSVEGDEETATGNDRTTKSDDEATDGADKTVSSDD
jgi:cell division protein FtsI (penicillin-binding protein 3)